MKMRGYKVKILNLSNSKIRDAKLVSIEIKHYIGMYIRPSRKIRN